VRTRWIVGALTSNTLCKNFVHQKTSNLQSQLQTKSVWPIPEELMKITAMSDGAAHGDGVDASRGAVSDMGGC
jgi:hypothetical protein